MNGELVQSDTSDTLLFPFGRLVADLSQLMTLEPGDVILTGTPAGSSVVVPGDVVEVEVDAPDAAGAPRRGGSSTTVVEGTVAVRRVRHRARHRRPAAHRGVGRRGRTRRGRRRGSRQAGPRARGSRRRRHRVRRIQRAIHVVRAHRRAAHPARRPSASRRSRSQLRKRGYHDIFVEGVPVDCGRARGWSGAPGRFASSRSGPTCSRATAAGSTRRSSPSTPSVPVRSS